MSTTKSQARATAPASGTLPSASRSKLSVSRARASTGWRRPRTAGTRASSPLARFSRFTFAPAKPCAVSQAASSWATAVCRTGSTSSRCASGGATGPSCAFEITGMLLIWCWRAIRSTSRLCGVNSRFQSRVAIWRGGAAGAGQGREGGGGGAGGGGERGGVVREAEPEREEMRDPVRVRAERVEPGLLPGGVERRDDRGTDLRAADQGAAERVLLIARELAEELPALALDEEDREPARARGRHGQVGAKRAPNRFREAEGARQHRDRDEAQEEDGGECQERGAQRHRDAQRPAHAAAARIVEDGSAVRTHEGRLADAAGTKVRTMLAVS